MRYGGHAACTLEGVCHQLPTRRQRSFVSAAFAPKKKRTRREVFVTEMERVVPWRRLKAMIKPLYLRSGRVGRQSIAVSRMLRRALPAAGVRPGRRDDKDALYERQSQRNFVGIDLPRE